jgi:TolA-binding protein
MRLSTLLLGCLCATVLQAADERLTFAEGLFRRGLSDQAAVEYEAFLQAPGEASESLLNEIRFNLAECYEKLGRNDEAREMYAKVGTSAEGERAAAAKLRLAKSYLDAEQAVKALPILDTLSVNNASTEIREAAQYYLASCYERVSRPRDAEALYKYIASQKGKYAEHARFARARLVAMDPNRQEEAETLYCEILADETDPERKREIALAAFSSAYRANRYGEAATFAKEVGENLLAKHALLLPASWAALRAGRPEEARVWLSADKTVNAAATPSRLILEASIATALGDELGAITAYERLLTEFPADAQAPVAAEAMLTLRARAGDPDAFLKAYARVATLLSESAVAKLMWYRLDAALQTSNAAHTRAAATWLIDHAPADQAAEASYRLGALEHKEKNYAAAGETWLRTAEKWPTMPCAGRAAYSAACAFRQAEMADRAEQALALALASGDVTVVPNALLLRARDALSEQDVAGAAAALDEYLTRFPQGKSVAEAAYLRGLIFFNAKDFQASADTLAKALAVNGDDDCTPLGHAARIDASMRRAQALHSLGQDDEAATLLQPLLGMKDAETLAPTYLRWLAEFRLKRGEWVEAEAAARVLSTKESATAADKVLAQTLIGRAAQGRGQTATALAAYEAALAVTTERTAYDAEAAVGLGELRLAEGDYAKARTAFTRAIGVANMDSAEGRLNRAKAYVGLAAACKALGLNAEALRANMSLIIFFEDKERTPQAFKEAIALLEAEGKTNEANRLRQEMAERYPAQEQQ